MTLKKIFALVLSLSLFHGSVLAEDLVDPRIVKSQNAFALKTFSAMSRQGGNVLLGALSAGALMRLLYMGSGGATQTEMAAALELGGLNDEEVKNTSTGLWTLSQSPDKDVEYYNPILMWSNIGAVFNQDYTARAVVYGMTPYVYTLSDPRTKRFFDEWARSKTNGHIEKITEFLDPAAMADAASAVYFKGKWTVPFPMQKISQAPFRTGDGSERQVNSMTVSGNFEFYKDEKFEAVNLRYGNGRLSLYVFVPASLPEFTASLAQEQVDSWLSGFLDRPGEVRFPQFKMEKTFDLRPVMKELGMSSAFDPQKADFSQGFTPSQARKNAFLGSVQQKVLIEFDEKGVKNPPSASPEIDPAAASGEHISLAVDRPFFFILRDNQTGVFLVLGGIYDPRPDMTASPAAPENKTPSAA